MSEAGWQEIIGAALCFELILAIAPHKSGNFIRQQLLCCSVYSESLTDQLVERSVV